MDDSYVEDDYEMQGVARASDCDDAFFKYALSVNYDVREVEGFFRDNVAVMLKPPKNSLLYELGVSDKIGYVKVEFTPNDQLLLCLNIAACYKCQKVFSYNNREEVLDFVKAHKCQSQSGAALNNSGEIPGNTDKNMSESQDVNTSGSSICSVGLVDDFQDVNRSSSSSSSIRLVDDFQDVNKSTLSVCTDDRTDDFQDMNKSSLSTCSAGQVNDIQNRNKSSSSIFNTRQADESETINIEESMNTSSDVSQNMEVDATASIIDSVHITDSDTEVRTAQDSAMLDLYNKLGNPLISAVVSQLYNYNLTVRLNEFYKTDRFTDVVVVCENEKIKCHKLVLSMYSAHFEELLRDAHTDTAVIYLEGLKFWQVRALIDYMYTGRIKDIEEGMWYLIEEAVDKLQFRDYLRPTELAVDSVNRSPHSTPCTNSQEKKKMRTYSRKR